MLTKRKSGRAPTPEQVLARLRALCLRLPEARETATFGHPTFKAGTKTFAVFEQYRSEGCICFKATHEDQLLLTMDPRFFVTPYVGKHGWTSLKVRGPLDWKEVEKLLLAGYRLVALKRMLRALERSRGGRR